VEKEKPTARVHLERESHAVAQARHRESSSSEKPLPLSAKARTKGKRIEREQAIEKEASEMAHQEQPGTPGSFERDSLFKRLRAKPENKVCSVG